MKFCIRLILITLIINLFALKTILSKETNIDNSKLSEGTYVYDPIEKFNRSVHNLNILIDTLAIQPVVTTYKVITPDIAEKGVSNFFSNLKEPLSSISFLFQGDIKKSFNSLARFTTNTVTTLGLYDTAKHINLEKEDTDLGIALGKAGLGSGPYIVLPILGPSNLRDSLGKVGDFFLNPLNIASSNIREVNTFGSSLNVRSEYDKEYNDLKNNSTDMYESLKLLYHQRRMGKINNDHLQDLPVPKIYIE